MPFSRRLGITAHKYNLCTSYSYMYVRRCALWPSARFIHRCKIYYRKIHTPKEISRARADPFKVQNEPKSYFGMFELATACRMVGPSIYGPRMRNSMRIYTYEKRFEPTQNGDRRDLLSGKIIATGWDMLQLFPARSIQRQILRFWWGVGFSSSKIDSKIRAISEMRDAKIFFVY